MVRHRSFMAASSLLPKKSVGIWRTVRGHDADYDWIPFLFKFIFVSWMEIKAEIAVNQEKDEDIASIILYYCPKTGPTSVSTLLTRSLKMLSTCSDVKLSVSHVVFFLLKQASVGAFSLTSSSESPTLLNYI